VKILALDTATEACSAALLLDDRLLRRCEVIGRGHAERLLPMVDELLREASVRLVDLDAIAVGRGPGAFTGVRIAISTAQGLAFGAGLPVVPVSDLAALAAAALERTGGADHALACLDARMGEVYWGLAQRSPDCELLAEGLATPECVPILAPDVRIVAAGHGWSRYPALIDRFGRSIVESWPDLLPDAGIIARLAVKEVSAGRVFQAESLEPTYLRNEVATRSGRPPAS